ncbi:HlyIII-domain-containing protein [Trametopsis cervina]|nr:HlyIII-domain-containing protein [Trametopsis cervina]
MSELRPRAAARNESAGIAILHSLEDFQSRIHYDPNDKPQIEEPRVQPNPNALTLTWDELQPWQQDNEFIRSGYRRVQYSFRGCAASVFGYLHNETVNIHSHLWGSLLFCFFLATFHQTHMASVATTTWFDTAVFVVFLTSAVGCLSFSAFYHTCEVHSLKVAASCNALDYAGIVLLTVGSMIAALYYGFYCDRVYQTMYMSVISLAGTVAAYIVLNPEFRKPTHRGARTKVFVSLGLCGVVPVTHLLVTHGFAALADEMGLKWLLASAFLYLNGATLYANRIPEKYWPGKFDYFFASHQIFHMHVLLAALAHYMCILTAFDHWHTENPMCSK